MRKTISVISILLLVSVSVLFSQNKNTNRAKAMASIKKNTNTATLSQMSQNFNKEYLRNKKEVDKWLKKTKMKRYVHLKDGTVLWIKKIKNGYPVIYTTRNVIAAITTSTNKVQPGGSLNLNLYGNYLGGMDMGIWDIGIPNQQHEAFIDQYNNHHLVIADTASNLTIEDHATHVAGTLIGDDSKPSAKGMAWGAFLRAWDAGNDLNEISYAVSHADSYTPYLTLSNHSYGPNLGWAKGLRNDPNNWYWTYDEIYSKDLRFGDYDSTSQNIDWIALNAPYYLMVRAVGNDRGESPVAFQDSYYYWDPNSNSWKSQLYTNQHPADGGADGYGCIPNDVAAKNILVVGAIDDISSGYSSPSDVTQNNTSFSNWGPTDDGRIKPDIVANGDSLYSAVYHNPANQSQTGNNYYDYKSGTSMASPNVSGSILLLQEYYLKTHSNNYPLATTLKALVINSVNAAGSNEGPDYKFGWGLLNTAGAAEIITEDVSEGINIQELSINNGQPVQFDVYSDGTLPIKATIVWNDPIPNSNNFLVHDLDLRITDENGNFYLPFVLDPLHPDVSATTGDDTKNNVEKIIIDNPSFGKYTVKISAKGNYSQNFSIVVSNVTAQPQNMKLTVKQFFEDKTTETDSVARYENSNFVNYSSGHIFTDVNNQAPVTLRATLKTLNDNQTIKEKFHDWNDNQKYINHSDFNLAASNTTIKSNLVKTFNTNLNFSAENTTTQYGSVELKDPWLRDDNSDPKGTRNRGTAAIWHSHTSPYSITTSGGNQGVFLGQSGPSHQWNPPYYSVKAVSPQIVNINGSNHKFYFQNWEAEPSGSATFRDANALETPVVFNSSGATVTANYKGHLLSNTAAATNSNSQRKIVQSYNGKWAVVYVSSNEVWLSTSTDGSNWGKEIKLSDEDGSGYVYDYPSVIMNGDNVYVVWQGINWLGGNGYDECKIYLRKYNLSANALYSTETVENFTPNVQYFNANPVIDGDGDTNYEEEMVAWREPDGIKVRYFDNYLGWSNISVVPETNGNSYNPSIADYNGYSYAVSWEDRGNAAIKYTMASGGQTWGFSTVEQISPSGWSQNVRPQITFVYGKPTVTWVSHNNISEGVSVHVRQRSGVGISDTWGSVTSFSMSNNNMVNAVLGSLLGSNNMDLLWDNAGTIYKASYNGFSWSSPTIIAGGSNGGDYVSINSNGNTGLMALWTKPDKSLMFYLSSGSPSLKIANNNTGSSTGNILTKTTSASNSQSVDSPEIINVRHTKHTIIELSNLFRDAAGLTSKPIKNIGIRSEGYIAGEVSWIKVNNGGITDNLDFTNSNNNISTVPFTVGEGQTTLDFGGAVYGSGINVSSMRLKRLSSLIARVSVKDSKTGNILKTIWAPSSSMFDGIRNKSFGEFKKANINISEFAGRKIYVSVDYPILNKIDIRPVIVDDYILQPQSGNGLIKKSSESITKENDIPQEYSLNQNFPNPFNPGTVISYDLPKASNVTLKIYNSIGQEIMTLVNGNQEAGHHSVTLNMSDYSSGIYFYRITADNFSAVKKLILMK